MTLYPRPACHRRRDGLIGNIHKPPGRPFSRVLRIVLCFRPYAPPTDSKNFVTPTSTLVEPKLRYGLRSHPPLSKTIKVSIEALPQSFAGN